MSAKFRSLIEDIFVILVFVGIIYGIYYFFFSSDEQVEQIAPIIKEEKVIEQKTESEPINPQNIIEAKKIIAENSTTEKSDSENSEQILETPQANETEAENQATQQIVEESENSTFVSTEKNQESLEKVETQTQTEAKPTEETIEQKTEGIKTQLKTTKYFLRSKPEANSKSLNKILRDETIIIESCNKYGWCKLLNQEAYIPKFVLKKF